MLNDLYIDRFCSHAEAGTFGEVSYRDTKLGYSIEQPWNNNKPFHSCVPAGRYELVPFYSETKHPSNTFAIVNELLNVYLEDQGNGTSRFSCLLHSANLAAELQGCLAFGVARSYFGVKGLRPEWALTQSMMKTSEIVHLIQANNIQNIVIRWPGFFRI